MSFQKPFTQLKYWIYFGIRKFECGIIFISEFGSSNAELISCGQQMHINEKSVLQKQNTLRFLLKTSEFEIPKSTYSATTEKGTCTLTSLCRFMIAV
jgi:hypothetical protein